MYIVFSHDISFYFWSAPGIGMNVFLPLGDSLARHNGMEFSTLSRDNDVSADNCAAAYHAPWWYYSCHMALFTTPYGDYPEVRWGIRWSNPWGQYKFGSFVRVMTRPNT